MPRFQPGDYVKAEFRDDVTGEGEGMSVVSSCDDAQGAPIRRASGQKKDNCHSNVTRWQ
jgi:hypothetical protein